MDQNNELVDERICGENTTTTTTDAIENIAVDKFDGITTMLTPPPTSET